MAGDSASPVRRSPRKLRRKPASASESEGEAEPELTAKPANALLAALRRSPRKRKAPAEPAVDSAAEQRAAKKQAAADAAAAQDALLGEEQEAGGEGEASDGEAPDRFAEITRMHAQVRNRVTERIESDVPEICRTEPCVLGIDEAGRGPVMGPMTYGIAFCPLSEDARLRKLGFADSKTLTEAQRDRLLRVIKKSSDFLGWKVDSLSPVAISGGMLARSNYNLNAMSHDTAISLIRKCIADGVNVAEVFVDTVGKAEWYQEKLQKLFPNLKIVVESKADFKYPIVSAASICAKVTRDQVMYQWNHIEKREISCVYGSGYPGDPSTKSWLRGNIDKVFGFPGIVRFSWKPAKDLLKEHAALVEWEDEYSDEEEGAETITSFFQPKDKPVTRHRYFKERHLEPLADF